MNRNYVNYINDLSLGQKRHTVHKHITKTHYDLPSAIFFLIELTKQKYRLTIRNAKYLLFTYTCT